MADLGARVVKIEPPGGDSMRYIQRQPYSPEGKSQMNGQVLDHGFTLGESAASAHTLAATHTHTQKRQAHMHTHLVGARPAAAHSPPAALHSHTRTPQTRARQLGRCNTSVARHLRIRR